MANHWQQLVIRTSSIADAEYMSDYLSEQGALSITFEDAGDEPLYEPQLGTCPLWKNTCLKVLFTSDFDLGSLIEKLTRTFHPLSWDHTVETIAEDDWQDKWKKDFVPLHVGKNLWVVPSWHEPPHPEAVNIRLDPGLAFGTGTHPTTQLCLESLANHDLQNKTVIDYGCGSGILAIAAIKLGAQHVWAVDIDPQALESTQINRERNAILPTQITPVHPDDLPSINVDLVIANILANPLLELAPTLTQLCQSKGRLVLSGLLKEQTSLIIERYEHLHPLMLKAQSHEWVLLESKIKIEV